MAKRKYIPRNHEVINEHIAAVLKTFNRQTELVYVQDELKNLPNLFVMFRPQARGISLTHLTKPEFDALRKFWEIAFAMAEPVVEELDRRAREAYESGSDDFARLYRQPPVFAVRQRVLDEYREGLPSGLDGVPRLDDPTRLDYLKWYRDGEGVIGVPPRDKGVSETPDADEEDDGVERLRKILRMDEPAGEVPGAEADEG